MDSEHERIMGEIARGTGRTQDDIRQMVEAKKGKFSGLLTDTGAAIMVAKELGVRTGSASAETTRISDLKEGMNNIDVVARIKTLFPPRQFDRNGRKGQLQNALLWDGSGEVRATFWNSDVEKFGLAKAGSSDVIRLENCAVSSYNGALQLSLNYNSRVTLAKNEDAPRIEKRQSKLEELEHGMNDVCVEVTVKKIFPAKEFENERGKGKVMNFIIAQGLEEMRATAWAEMCDTIEEIGEGAKVRIEGAYVKENRGENELHLGRNARAEKGIEG
ncbi:MAG: hypothetical protein HY544_02920 [Candidatus Diapherotrites archaeon]|uniref:DUF2240 family protein n=1 Tax=Candidatus Iainarchaeum sp. TaxID=3101447 RepID=A0A8T3YKU7_9ARCH|nr:hypothetical protein [Candidatus Diapherotrites archaeon]